MQVLIVVVRYKTPLEKSQTICSLSDTFSQQPELLKSVRLLVWDNSPDPVKDPYLPFEFEYRHSEENVGVSGAYNHAMEVAESIGCPWMLLFDQDTTVPADFVAEMLKKSQELQSFSDVAAVAPFIYVGDIIVSPKRSRYGVSRPFDQGFVGITYEEATVINTGVLMRVCHLRKVGGYSNDFWLDYSDIYVFYQIYRHGFKVWVSADLKLNHLMTILDFDGSMSEMRYRNFIAAEDGFVSMYRSRIKNIVYTLRLFARILRQRQRYANKVFSEITAEYAWRRIFSSKRKRIELWRIQLSHRQIPIIDK